MHAHCGGYCVTGHVSTIKVTHHITTNTADWRFPGGKASLARNSLECHHIGVPGKVGHPCDWPIGPYESRFRFRERPQPPPTPGRGGCNKGTATHQLCRRHEENDLRSPGHRSIQVNAGATVTATGHLADGLWDRTDACWFVGKRKTKPKTNRPKFARSAQVHKNTHSTFKSSIIVTKWSTTKPPADILWATRYR
jgi:hypothetical protein